MVLAIALPALGGALCWLVPARAERTHGAIAMASAALTLGLAVSVLARGPDAVEIASWLTFGVDRLSGFVLAFAALFALLIAIYSMGYMRGRERPREYFSYLQWTLGVACGALLASDLILLLAFWGVLAVILYLMVLLSGEQASEAARKSLVTVGGSDALLLLGAVLVWQITGSTRLGAEVILLEDTVSYMAFAAFAAAAFAKAGAVPLHAWVPDCAERAHAPVTALLPASLDKLLGIYLLARASTDLFELNGATRAALMTLGALTILVAVFLALVQQDLKRLLGYHAVSQVGYMVLGIGTGTAIGVVGGLFHMLNHALYKSCLFLGAGAVERAAGTTELDRLGGLGHRMPITFAVMVVAALAISGIPPLNGFASKWMVYRALVEVGADGGAAWVLWLTAAMLGSALTLASFVKVLHATFLCPPSPDVARREIREAPTTMLVPMCLLAASCVVFGVLAGPLAVERLIGPAVRGDPGEMWDSGAATALLLLAVAAGALVYLWAARGTRLRRVETYVGGERLDSTYIRDEPAPPARDVRVSGVDFYRTIEGLGAMRRAYAVARSPAFDLYELGRRCLLYLVVVLRAGHTGALPAYLTWFLLGVLGIVYLIARGGP